MCGIIGIFGPTESENIQYSIFEGLFSLQHRGQDSFGIATDSYIVKHNGLVKSLSDNSELSKLNSHMCIGHVRYATNGVSNDIQPYYNIFPSRVTLCHNGNITNIKKLQLILKTSFNVDYVSDSDSEYILTLFCIKLYQYTCNNQSSIDSKSVIEVSNYLQETLEGSFSIIILIQNYGMVVVRDKLGIRPLVYGKKNEQYIVSSESCALSLLNFDIIRDVKAGETIIFKNGNDSPIFHQYSNSKLTPCLFEYLYFSRPDSILDNVSVYNARIEIGKIMGKKMKKLLNCDDIDYIIPVPDTSMTFCIGIQEILQKPIREGFIKNKYVDRTFIMKDNQIITKNVRRKLTANEVIFRDKVVLILDDSIVRGNTSNHIIKNARKCGAKKIYFGSCSPVVKNTNQFGIYIPTKKELVSYNRNEDEIRKEMDVDHLIYNDIEEIKKIIKNYNPLIYDFETSMFED